MTTTTLLALALALAAADKGDDKAERKPSIYGPSIPQLTKEEEKKLDEIIDRFILADTGKLTGAAAKKAVKELEALTMEAVPALLRGLNRAAKINHSCPVTMIAKKLLNLLNKSTDTKLLELAVDEIGADVGKTTHARMLQDLRFRVRMRKNAVARMTPVAPKLPAKATTSDLVKSASTVRGAALKGVVTELAKRDGKDVLGGLATVAGSYDKDAQKWGRDGLDSYLGRQSSSTLKEHFSHSAAEVRKGAIRVARAKHDELTPQIIEALTDKDKAVRAEARAALKKIAKDKEDFGPEDGATAAQQREAQKKWKAWWQQQTGPKE
jgi:hypothetical protein